VVLLLLLLLLLPCLWQVVSSPVPPLSLATAAMAWHGMAKHIHVIFH
jgi:hypothetical protein